jgi:phospholipid/cholesterol/gamma-HCH transport system ATP-binding protein
MIPVLEFRGVTVWFEGQPVLDRVSFQLQQGETRVLLGSAGAGKTVLLKTAMGLIVPDSGSVRVLGQDLSELGRADLTELRSGIGMLFQESALFDSLTVRDNVAYPLENQRRHRLPSNVIEDKVREALRFVGLEHTLDRFPSELSGGMRRRVGIARANVTDPLLMFYDSPTAGLDPITANTIMALLVKNRDTRQTTSIVVTHRLQDGELLVRYKWDPAAEELTPDSGCESTRRTSFLVLNQGQLVFEGTELELRASRDPYVGRFVRKVA